MPNVHVLHKCWINLIFQDLAAGFKDAVALGLLQSIDPALAAEAIALAAPSPLAYEAGINNVRYFSGGVGYLANPPNPALRARIAAAINAGNY